MKNRQSVVNVVIAACLSGMLDRNLLPEGYDWVEGHQNPDTDDNGNELPGWSGWFVIADPDGERWSFGLRAGKVEITLPYYIDDASREIIGPEIEDFLDTSNPEKRLWIRYPQPDERAARRATLDGYFPFSVENESLADFIRLATAMKWRVLALLGSTIDLFLVPSQLWDGNIIYLNRDVFVLLEKKQAEPA